MGVVSVSDSERECFNNLLSPETNNDGGHRMIYALNESTGILMGVFDTLAMASEYITTKADTSSFNYIFLEKVDQVKYISRVAFVDGSCIFNNKNFWTVGANAIFQDFENHTVLDAFYVPVPKDRFLIEWQNNSTRLSCIIDTPSEVAYNMQIGQEFIALFREKCIKEERADYSGLDIAIQMAGLIPLLQTGSFKEAIEFLAVFPRNTYFTDSVLNHYSALLVASDAITYRPQTTTV